jgi:signal transduction histidine kinase
MDEDEGWRLPLYLNQMHMPEIYFIYGLVFFTSGIVIVAQSRHSGAFSFGKQLWLLGVFALLHGFSEWGYLFIPIKEPFLSLVSIRILYNLRNFLGALSFLILLLFGLRLLFPRYFWLSKILPLAIFVSWLSAFVYYFPYSGRAYSIQYALFSETLNRYLLAIPSGFITAYALYRQSKYAQETRFAKEMTQSLRGLALSFLFYVFFGGVVVPNAPFFPAYLINTGWFYSLTHLPVQVFRALCGLSIMIYTLKLLGTFNRETEYLLIQTKEDALRKTERERISRDLHDGVIQTLYAVELIIENSLYKMDPESPTCSELAASMTTLDRAIFDLREYIKGLRNDFSFQQPIQKMLQNILAEFQFYALNCTFEFQAHPDLAIAVDKQDHLYHVIKELLNNVIKHARTDQVNIEVKENNEQIILILTDHGIGIAKEHLVSSNPHGMGLRHTRERIALLQGEIHFEHALQGGTKVTMIIPKKT